MITVFDFGQSRFENTNFEIAVICKAKSCSLFNFICTLHITEYFILIFFKFLIVDYLIYFENFMFEIFVVSVSNLALI